VHFGDLGVWIGEGVQRVRAHDTKKLSTGMIDGEGGLVERPKEKKKGGKRKQPSRGTDQNHRNIAIRGRARRHAGYLFGALCTAAAAERGQKGHDAVI